MAIQFNTFFQYEYLSLIIVVACPLPHIHQSLFHLLIFLSFLNMNNEVKMMVGHDFHLTQQDFPLMWKNGVEMMVMIFISPSKQVRGKSWWAMTFLLLERMGWKWWWAMISSHQASKGEANHRPQQGLQVKQGLQENTACKWNQVSKETRPARETTPVCKKRPVNEMRSASEMSCASEKMLGREWSWSHKWNEACKCNGGLQVIQGLQAKPGLQVKEDLQVNKASKWN